MIEISDYERWKFRRCIETIRRYACTDSNNKCEMCDFDIELLKWDTLHIKFTDGDLTMYLTNDDQK